MLPRVPMRRLAWIAAFVLVLGAVAWVFRPTPIDVETAAVAIGRFTKTVDEEGRTRVRERYVVSAPLAGRLLRVTFKPGDLVAEGQTVALLQPADPALLDARAAAELAERVGAAEARVQGAAAAVERAQAAVALARSDVERTHALAAQGFVSRQAVERLDRDLEVKSRDLDVARFERHAADHDVATAQAAASSMRSSGARSAQEWRIRSPVAGRVLRVLQESEAVVAIGAPLLELGDASDLEVVVDILTIDAELVRVGNDVLLLHGQGTLPLKGRVRRIEPGAFTKVSALGVEEQRAHVVVDLDAPAGSQALGDAYRVDARIVVAEEGRAMLVPVPALFRQGSDWAVYVVDGSRALARVVRIGLRNSDQAVVEDGLREGDVVVVYPPSTLRDGARVKQRAVDRRAAPRGK